jgi:hypothetical protein
VLLSIEPATDEVPEARRTRSSMLASIAISLKRIADVFDGNLSAGGFMNLEQLAWSMGPGIRTRKGCIDDRPPPRF